jgi:curli biogenesis system outer membrane secretion channel CsgG
MKQIEPPLKLMVLSSLVVAALAVAGLSASAQTATTSTTSTPTASTALRTGPKPTTATDQMVQEACQRQKARTAKFQQFGIKEQWGSEEPFVFDPKAPRC